METFLENWRHLTTLGVFFVCLIDLQGLVAPAGVSLSEEKVSRI